jgi:predicted negative regulator of RcsB-dependent stress response
VEVYQTEEQQVEAIKRFWSENGNSIIAGLVIGFAGFIGFNYYQDHKKAEEEAIADQYMTLLEVHEKSPEQFIEQGQAFVNKYGESSYASLTALAMAKTASDKKEWANATKHLQLAIAKAPHAGIKAIATLRLARTQAQQAQYEEALKTLTAALPKSFTASVEEAKGDIYILQGNRELARNAYQQAISADGLKASPALQMKIDDLAVALD